MDAVTSKLLLEAAIKGIDLAWLAFEAGHNKDELNDQVQAKIDAGEIQSLDDLGNWLEAQYATAAAEGREAIRRKREGG